MSSVSNPAPGSVSRRQLWLTKVFTFLAVSVFLGWFYGWADSRFFPEKTRVGFAYGVMHGALMPMALPGLVMGKDVEIYDNNNTGRNYKLGYIVGINVCGLLFFGSAFWRLPKKWRRAETFPAPAITETSSEKSQ